MRLVLPALVALLASCSGETPPEPANLARESAPLAPLTPPEPGEPGGLADDRTPVSEAPFTADSAQGAANVVQTYYAFLEAGRYDEAWRLWSDSGMSPAEFAAGFDGYAEYHANVGAPGRIEGAAGSLYIEVPVQVYGRLKGGEPFNRLGTVRLRRSNHVPGATPEQLEWRIFGSDVRPPPAG